MSRTIWKWTLSSDRETVQMPRGAQMLAVQMQGSMPQVWALCDPEAPKEPRLIAIYGTGHTLPDVAGEYIGTFQLHDGALVFHAFEVRPKPTNP